MKRSPLLFLASSLVGASLIWSCQSEPDLANAPQISFSNNIQPILAGNCTMNGCHNGAGYDEAFPLDNYDDVAKHVIAGNARNSEIYRSVANRTDRLMPPNGPLADEDIMMIYLWIEQGAKNN